MRERRLWLASLAGAVWLAHAVEVVWRGSPVELLWMCNVAGLLLTIGCALWRSSWVAVALSFLVLGTPLWLGDLLAGGELYPTSIGSHLGGIAIGVVASRRMGWDRHAWWRAELSLLGLVLTTRWLFPAAEDGNVNLAFRVWPGWEAMFTSYPPYFAFLFVACGAVFVAVHLAATRWLTTPVLSPAE